MMFVFLICSVIVFQRVYGQGDAAAACGAVLQQGVFNIFSNDLNKNSYSQFQGAICTVSPNVTYAAYLNSSTWDSWNLAASFFHITNDEQSPMSESQYHEFQQVAASYQGSYCGILSSNEGNSELFHEYMQTTNPEVFAAYQSCLDLYATGIRFSSQFGFGSNSVFINIEFVSTTFGARAMITGLTIVPPNTAGCVLHSDSGDSTDFHRELTPDETYSVACHSFGNDTATDVITVGISTTQGTYVTNIYNTPQVEAAISIAQLQAQVRQLAAQVKHSQRLLSRLTNNNNIIVNNNELHVLEIAPAGTSPRSSASVMDASSRTVESRNAVVSLSPTPLTISVAEDGVYLVAYNGRLKGFTDGKPSWRRRLSFRESAANNNGGENNWWNIHLNHHRCGCDLSTAYGGHSDANTGNYWIGSLTAGDVLEMKFLVNSDSESGVVTSADEHGVNSLHAIWLRPSSETDCSCMM